MSSQEAEKLFRFIPEKGYDSNIPWSEHREEPWRGTTTEGWLCANLPLDELRTRLIEYECDTGIFIDWNQIEEVK